MIAGFRTVARFGAGVVHRLRQRPSLSAPTQGALWMLVSCLAAGSMPVIVRHMSADLPSLQIGFLRFAAGALLMVPWALSRGFGAFRTQRFGFHCFRAASGVAAMAFSFTAFALMPLADATALTFTTPLFATIGAALVLGEVVRVRRWTAILVGFLGAAIIIRPGMTAVSWPALFMLASAFFAAVSALCMKSLSRTESPMTAVIYMSFLIMLLSAGPAMVVWQPVPPSALGWGLLLGVLGSVANFAMICSFRKADASAVMSLDFTRLIVVATMAFLLFDERPDSWTWVGAGVIFSATLYTTHREAKLARRQRALALAEASSQQALTQQAQADAATGPATQPPAARDGVS